MQYLSLMLLFLHGRDGLMTEQIRIKSKLGEAHLKLFLQFSIKVHKKFSILEVHAKVDIFSFNEFTSKHAGPFVQNTINLMLIMLDKNFRRNIGIFSFFFPQENRNDISYQLSTKDIICM